MKKLGSWHRAMDTDISHMVSYVHVHTMFCQVFPQCPGSHHLVVTIWKSFSSSSRYSGVLAGVALGVGGVLAGVLSSSDELNESHLYTGLDGVCGMFHGVTGSGLKEACSMLET